MRSQTAAPTRAVDYPEQPAIDARPAPGEVTFTWNYVGAEEGDFFQLRVADSEAAVVDKDVTTVQGRPRHTVKATAGDLVCAQVAVSRKSGARRRRARRSAARPPADRHPRKGRDTTWEPPSSSAARSSRQPMTGR